MRRRGATETKNGRRIVAQETSRRLLGHRYVFFLLFLFFVLTALSRTPSPTPTPPSSLANASRGRGFTSPATSYNHPSLLARKCEPGVGYHRTSYQLPATTTVPPRSQTRAGGGFLPYQLPASTTPPSSLANASRGWGITLPATCYHHPSLLARKCEPGGGYYLTSYQLTPPHPPC